MTTLLSVIVLVCPLLAFSNNIIKANVDPVIGNTFQHEPSPEFYSKNICGDPECDLVCTENQVGDDCYEDLDVQLVHQDFMGCHCQDLQECQS